MKSSASLIFAVTLSVLALIQSCPDFEEASLQTDSADENTFTISLPMEFTAEDSQNIVTISSDETSFSEASSPNGGSYYSTDDDLPNAYDDLPNAYDDYYSAANGAEGDSSGVPDGGSFSGYISIPSDTPARHGASDSSMESAQNAFMVTHHSADYEEAVYEAFAALRYNCRLDFEVTCSASAQSSGSLNNALFSLMAANIFSSFFAPAFPQRRLADIAVSPAQHLSFLHDFKGKFGLGQKLNSMAGGFAAFRDGFKNPVSTAAAPVPEFVVSPPPVRVAPISGGDAAFHLTDGVGSSLPRGRMHTALMNFGSVSPLTQKQLSEKTC